MEQFESHEEELNFMSFGIPQAEIDAALSLFKNQLIKEPFKYDNWKELDGLKYLAGIYDYGGEGDSQYLRTLANVHYETNPSMYVIRGFLSRLDEFRRIWDSGNHPEKSPPNCYIEWALSKKLAIHWLLPALDQGLIQLEGISSYPLLANYAKENLPNHVVNGEQPAKPKEIGDNHKPSHLSIIGAMLELMLGQTKMGKPNSVFETQEAIIAAIDEKYHGKYGLSSSNLNKTFPKAKKSLDGD